MNTTFVELKLENEKGNIETHKMNIKRLKVKQYGDVMKIVGKVTRQITENEALMNTFKVQFAGVIDEEWKDKETGELLSGIEAKLQADQLGTLAFILEHFPEELINLVSVASNINKKVLDELEDEEFLNVITAVIEVNDLKRLGDVGKKFLENIKGKMTVKASEENQKSHLQSVTQ